MASSSLLLLLILLISPASPLPRNPPPKPFRPLSHLRTTLLTLPLLLPLLLPLPSLAENELSSKYGGGIHTDLVDTVCLQTHCTLQASKCLAADPSCRKGLTCIAKCLGDNMCITGCEARYGSRNLDNLLKCTIEDHDCIKVAILPGGSDALGTEPSSPRKVVEQSGKMLEGSWFKVMGFNPNYDCYMNQVRKVEE